MSRRATRLARSPPGEGSSTSTANTPPSRAGGRAPRTAPEAVAHLYEQLVPDAVAEAIVDRLEVVEIDEEDGPTATGRTCDADRPLHTTPQQGAVGQTGQRIVERPVDELVLEHLALVDDTMVDDDAPHRRLVEQVGEHRLRPAPPPPRVHTDASRRTATPQGRPARPRTPPTPWPGRRGARTRHRSAPAGTRHPTPGCARRRATPTQAALIVEDRDHVRGPLHQGPEPLLALALGLGLDRPSRGRPYGDDQVGHQLADQDEEESAAADPVARRLGCVRGDVGRQQRPGHERGRRAGDQSTRGRKRRPARKTGRKNQSGATLLAPPTE